MTTYKLLKCPRCTTEAQNARRAGSYKVLETKNFIILKCSKCGNKQYLRRKWLNGDRTTPAQIEVTTR